MSVIKSFSLLSSCNAGDQVSHPYKTTENIIIISFWDSRRDDKGILNRMGAKHVPNLTFSKRFRKSKRVKTCVTLKSASWGPHVRSKVMSCGICGDKSRIRVGFLRVRRFPLPIFFTPTAPCSLINISWTLCALDTDRTVKNNKLNSRVMTAGGARVEEGANEGRQYLRGSLH
jgi:hypothetical protein